MVYREILYSVEMGGIAVITLNRPGAMNALTHLMHDELRQALEEANRDANVRVIILTGNGRGFCSGDDVKLMFRGGTGYEESGGGSMFGEGSALKYLQGGNSEGGGGPLLRINKPTIAAVNGAAVGYGCDLTLMCDMRIASERARFGEVFLRVGLLPDQALLLLPRLVGLGKAYELLLTTDIIDAQEAYRIGLVNRVVPHEQLMPAALELAGRIASKAPIAARLAKEGVRRGLNMELDAWSQWQAMAFNYCTGTDDHREGAKAFVEKRPPEFKGR